MNRILTIAASSLLALLAGFVGAAGYAHFFDDSVSQMESAKTMDRSYKEIASLWEAFNSRNDQLVGAMARLDSIERRSDSANGQLTLLQTQLVDIERRLPRQIKPAERNEFANDIDPWAVYLAMHDAALGAQKAGDLALAKALANVAIGSLGPFCHSTRILRTAQVAQIVPLIEGQYWVSDRDNGHSKAIQVKTGC